jgi:hypothetical protein
MLATSSLGFQNIKIKLTIIYNNMLIKESFSFCYEKIRRAFKLVKKYPTALYPHTQKHIYTKKKHDSKAFPLVRKFSMPKIRTFWIRSSAPPVTKVSFPLSSIVTAESFSKVMPAAKGWPGLLQNGS